MDGQNITDAQMEAEFQERNKNLKKSLNNIVDKIDQATQTTHDFLEADNSTLSSSNTIVSDRNLSAFKASGNPEFYGGSATLTSSNRRPSLVREQEIHQVGWESGLDRKLMNSINDDIVAMHSTDPELFEGVASKFDETFGANALV